MKIFDFITKTFNNREISIAIWVTLIFIIFMTKKGFREKLSAVLKTIFSKKIIRLIVMMLIYITILVGFLFIVEFWDEDLLKETIYWIFAIAIVSLFNITNVNYNYFKTLIIQSLKLVIILEFITNFYIFSFFIELCLLPIILYFIKIKIISEYKDGYERKRKIADAIISIYGICILAFSIYHIVFNFKSFASIQNLKSIFISPVLTLLFIPFLYFIALLITYERFFVKIKTILKDNKRLFHKLRRIIFYKCHLNLNRILQVSNKLHIYSNELESKILEDLNLLVIKKPSS